MEFQNQTSKYCKEDIFKLDLPNFQSNLFRISLNVVNIFSCTSSATKSALYELLQ